MRQMLESVFGRFVDKHKKVSYSQCGEDIIVDYIMQSLNVKNPTYIDIGANDPIKYNNTYLFYKKGYSGVCIEPDPTIYNRLSKVRKRDICLNIGINVDDEGRELADFYILTSNTLNTFSKERADEIVKNKYFGEQEIVQTIKIPMKSIKDVIHQHFNTIPTFISLDVEGLELNILKTLNFKSNRPLIFCIETAEFKKDTSLGKNYDIINFMENNNYMVYADTFINSIFVDEKVWSKKYGLNTIENTNANQQGYTKGN